MNFIFKMMMVVLSSVYVHAVCTAPETNASNNLRLAHSVCPKLFDVDNRIKEKTVIQYYRNDHRGIFGNLVGYPISINLNGEIIRQAWDPAGLAKTVQFLRDKIVATGRYTAISSVGKLTVTAMTSGYELDATAVGGTNNMRDFGFSADVNYSGFGTTYGLGYNATKEVKTYELNGTGIDINLSKTNY